MTSFPGVPWITTPDPDPTIVASSPAHDGISSTETSSMYPPAEFDGPRSANWMRLVADVATKSSVDVAQLVCAPPAIGPIVWGAGPAVTATLLSAADVPGLAEY